MDPDKNAGKTVPADEENGFLYQQLADKLATQIRDGTFRAGDKLPSIRHLHRHCKLSIATVYRAFLELERRNLVDARQKSGYFVNHMPSRPVPAPQVCAGRPTPLRITVANLHAALCEAMGKPEILQLGGALIAAELLPGKELADVVRKTSPARLARLFAGYDHYQGYMPLRRLLAQRSDHLFGPAAPEDIVITHGAMDAVAICLQAVTRPGDTVLVESPAFPWFLQVIEDHNLYALEIPADPESGIDMAGVADAVARYPVKACIFIGAFNNPLGFLMPDEKKKALVDLMASRGIPIIEDDIYGDLYFGPSRPRPMKAYDRHGLVLYCSSFSKTLSPGLRVGWTLPGRFLDKVRRLKLNQQISPTALPQLVIATFLRNGSYDRHLRKLRACLCNQVSDMAADIVRLFPPGIRISSPGGGLSLWLQMDDRVDSLDLFQQALACGIAVMPGIIFSGRPIYRNCIRISCGHPWSDRLHQGLRQLAEIVVSLQNGSREAGPMINTPLTFTGMR